MVLSSWLEEPLKVDLPAMSVDVERGVKEVTRVATKCADSQERDGAVLQTITARSKIFRVSLFLSQLFNFSKATQIVYPVFVLL